MENKYEVIINLDEKMKEIYIKRYEKEEYQIIKNENHILFVKKGNKYLEKEKQEEYLITLALTMITKYPIEGILYISFSEEFNKILEKIEKEEVLDIHHYNIPFFIRTKIVKAISKKHREEVYEED